MISMYSKVPRGIKLTNEALKVEEAVSMAAQMQFLVVNLLRQTGVPKYMDFANKLDELVKETTKEELENEQADSTGSEGDPGGEEVSG